MTRDYKKRSSAPRKKKPVRPATPGWIWLITGLSLGLFVAFLIYIRDQGAASTPAPADSERQTHKSEEKEQKTGSGSRFQFYTLLPEMEVVVPDTTTASGSEKRKANVSPQRFLLQAGSFRRWQDADARKASLALLGVESEIQKVELENDEVWHRVRVGPYASRRELDSVRTLLFENEIETLLIRIKDKG